MALPASADVVIVGSGIAGALVAHRLAEAGASVVMLEAGPRVGRWRYVENFRNLPSKDDPTLAYPADRLAPHPQEEAYSGLSPDPVTPGSTAEPYLRANRHLILKGPDAAAYAQRYIRAAGGTSWSWAATAWRFLPNDFHLASLYGVGRDWPIGYDDLERYYHAAEIELGVSGPNDSTEPGSPRSHAFPMEALPLSYRDARVREVLAGAGLTLVAEPVARNSRPYDGRPTCCGSNSCVPVCPIGAMYNGIVHVEKAEAAGAALVTEAVAHHVEADGSGRIAAIHAFGRDGGSFRVAGRIFVIAANGIETPRLLLNSAGGRFAAGIANSSGEVGRNLMDRPATGLSFLGEEALWPGRGPVEMTALVDFRDGAFRSDQAAKTIALGNEAETRRATLKALAMGLSGRSLEAEIRRRAAHTVRLRAAHEILPSPDNRLVLSPDHKDGLGIPRPQITYDVGDYVRRSAGHSREVLQRIADRLGGSELVFDDGFRPSHQMMGSVIMGTDPKTSVVDGTCRTHDHDNLFLATSGVMPSGGSADSTLTLAALSLRIADSVKAGL